RTQHSDRFVPFGDQDFLAAFHTREQVREFMIGLACTDCFHEAAYVGHVGTFSRRMNAWSRHGRSDKGGIGVSSLLMILLPPSASTNVSALAQIAIRR